MSEKIEWNDDYLLGIQEVFRQVRCREDCDILFRLVLGSFRELMYQDKVS